MRAVFGTLSLILLFVLSGCNEELKVSERECTSVSLSGTWKAVALKKEGDGLLNIPSREEIRALGYSSLLITIPDEVSGIVLGTNFQHVVCFDFGIEDQTISFGVDKFSKKLVESDTWSGYFATNLQNSTSFCFSDEKLYFLNNQNEDLIAFERITNVTFAEVPEYPVTSCGTESIQGKWEMTKVRVKQFDELRSVVNLDYWVGIGYIEMTIASAGIDGHTFNNYYGGVFEVFDDQQFFVPNIGGSRADNEFWGREFMSHINSPLTYCLTGHELAMFNEEGKTVLVFEKVVEP